MGSSRYVSENQVQSASDATLTMLQPYGIVTCCHAGQEIAQTTPEHPKMPEHWHCVLRGTVRHCAVHSDGRRQIVDLLLVGDWFGFATPSAHCMTAEAVVEGTLVISYPRQRVEALANTNLDVARAVADRTSAAIARLQRQLLVLGRITALEKVGAFLLELSARLSTDSADRVLLPISRYDIADYLAISVETVSRSLTDLRQRGVIALHGAREVRIINRGALEEPSSNHAKFGAAARRAARAQHFPNSDWSRSRSKH
jgi:CRP/FNR family nitrogen fixation transcriptional regulator